MRSLSIVLFVSVLLTCLSGCNKDAGGGSKPVGYEGTIVADAPLFAPPQKGDVAQAVMTDSATKMALFVNGEKVRVVTSELGYVEVESTGSLGSKRGWIKAENLK